MSGNNPLYSCDTAKETSKGKSVNTVSVFMTNGICCDHWMD